VDIRHWVYSICCESGRNDSGKTAEFWSAFQERETNPR